MGAVHGVYLKYVGLSALSYAGYSVVMALGDEEDRASLLTHGVRMLADSPGSAMASGGAAAAATIPLWRLSTGAVLGYSAFVNGMIAVLFKMERGMSLLGKNLETGGIPLWSYLLFFPFHYPTKLYTYLHTRLGSFKTLGEKRRERVPVATEVQPGWWVGGCYGSELDMDWAGIIDLTVEFPENCINRTEGYLSMPTWDGVPATPDQLEEAANFAVEAHKKGPVLIHCAHGRGRSTTIMCAALVKAGLYKDYLEALEKGIRPARPVCKLNKRMRQNLAAWQKQYIEGKKGV